MDARATWAGLGAFQWIVSYFALLFLTMGLGRLTIGAGNALFVVGALVILVSVGFIGVGEKRVKLVRDNRGFPITTVKLDPKERASQISKGVKIFLVGLALWLPLLYLAFL